MSNRYKGLCRSPEKQTVKPCYSLGNEDAAGREGRTPFWKQRRHSATWCTGKRYCRHPGRHLCLKEVSGCHSTLAQPLSVCLSVILLDSVASHETVAGRPVRAALLPYRLVTYTGSGRLHNFLHIELN